MRKVIWIGTTAASIFMALGNGAVAYAAKGGGEQIGENLGGLLGNWAQSLYAGVAALVAVMFLLNRKYVDLAVFAVAAIVIGGFVMAPDDVASVVTGIWNTVTGTKA